MSSVLVFLVGFAQKQVPPIFVVSVLYILAGKKWSSRTPEVHAKSKAFADSDTPGGTEKIAGAHS